MRTLIDRPDYIKALNQHKDVDLVKILTGIRRCGKSSILSLFYNELKKNGIDDNHIIFMNLESLRYRHLNNYLNFYDSISSKIASTGRTYILLDEIQSVDGWEKAIESLRLEYDVDIYITGSNAYLLSSEMATLLTGRYVEIKIFPLSFKEFCSFYTFDPSISVEEKFTRYMQLGGMPILAQYNMDETLCHQALEGIYSTVVMRDIMQRIPQSDFNTLQKVIRFLCSNIGSITSPNRISNLLSAEGELDKKSRIAGKTVSNYLEYIQNAFIFYPVERYDIKGKQLLKTLEKYYIADIGFRHLLLGYRDADRGHLLENVVFLELLRRHYHVYIGKIHDLEVDFIAEKHDEKIYIQVTESMLSEETRQRELKPLMTIPDHYSKLVLSMDRDFIHFENGIRMMYLPDWLG